MLLYVLLIFSGISSFALTEDELQHCKQNSDCIVVPYSHCCGSTKRAINKKHKLLYESKPEWQKFSDPAQCALMGACMTDKYVTEAECRGEKVLRCQLKYGK